MIDLHTHSLFSDGELLLSELVRRAEVRGYRVVAVTDHVDLSNLDFVVPRVVKTCAELTLLSNITALPGVEITHCPPRQIRPLVREARRLGARIVCVHGETLVEPVIVGTNRAAIEAECDILAHPGLIDEMDVALAAKRGVHLEISARKGHCLANGHVAALARVHKAKLIFGSDSHAPDDLVTKDAADRILAAAGLSGEEVATAWDNAERLVNKALRRSKP
jgi:histidinol phosphatase-like PHP family hydrolase